MLQITPQHKLLIAIEPIDFRKGIDGLVALGRAELHSNPFDGCLFAFRNKLGTSIKLLIYDGNGFWLCQKRFSTGHLSWWPQNAEQANALRAVELLIILQQGNPYSAQIPQNWRALPHQEDY